MRKRFEERFTARRMANDYLAVYRSLLAEREGPHLRIVGENEAAAARLSLAQD